MPQNTLKTSAFSHIDLVTIWFRTPRAADAMALAPAATGGPDGATERRLRSQFLGAARSERDRCLAATGPPAEPLKLGLGPTAEPVNDDRQMEAESADGDRQTQALQALRLLVERGLRGQMANLEARVAELEAEVVHERQLREAV